MAMRSLIFLVALWCAGGPAPALAQGGPAGVTTDVVSTREISETVSVFGQIVAGRESSVAARVMGVATEVPLQVGDRVDAGDVLARMDTERLELELAQAEAELAIAEAGIAVAVARLDRTEKAMRRTETLRENATVSQAQVDDRAGEYAEAVGNRQQAQARITVAESAIRRARYDLDNAVVRAPFTGTILEVMKDQGEFIAMGDTVARMLDTSALEIEANIPARLVPALRQDQTVTVRTDTGVELTVTLRTILPTEFSSTRTRPVRFTLDGDAEEVALGQSVTLDVPVSAPREVVVVPKDAVVQSGGGWQVFVNQDGTAAPRTVEIGTAIGETFEVLSGLAPGDEIVVRGNERLRPGQEIQAQRAGTAPDGAGPPDAEEAQSAPSNEG